MSWPERMKKLYVILKSHQKWRNQPSNVGSWLRSYYKCSKNNSPRRWRMIRCRISLTEILSRSPIQSRILRIRNIKISLCSSIKTRICPNNQLNKIIIIRRSRKLINISISTIFPPRLLPRRAMACTGTPPTKKVPRIAVIKWTIAAPLAHKHRFLVMENH